MRTLFGFLIFSLLIVLVAPRTLEWLAHQPLPPWEWQSLEDAFDCDKTRNTELDVLMKQEFAETIVMRADDAKDGIDTSRDSFCFAFVDLNGDKRADFILDPNFGRIFCGSAGCSYYVYEQNPDGVYRQVGDLFAADGLIFISRSAINGYKKIAAVSRFWIVERTYNIEQQGYDPTKSTRIEE